jgi:hypothetical protein
MPKALEGVGVEHLTLDRVKLNERMDRVADLEMTLLHDAGIQTPASGVLAPMVSAGNAPQRRMANAVFAAISANSNIRSHVLIVLGSSDGPI